MSQKSLLQSELFRIIQVLSNNPPSHFSLVRLSLSILKVFLVPSVSFQTCELVTRFILNQRFPGILKNFQVPRCTSASPNSESPGPSASADSNPNLQFSRYLSSLGLQNCKFLGLFQSLQVFRSPTPSTQETRFLSSQGESSIA